MDVEFHREALAEFEAAAKRYSLISEVLATRFIDAVEHAISLIRESPMAWRLVDDGIRRCLTKIFPYALLYTVEADRILVLAIMHCSREPNYWSGRREK